MMIDETNITRLLLALYLYRETRGSYAPVSNGAMESAIKQAHVALSERGYDTQSRMDRVFHDDLPLRIRNLVDYARALANQDDNVGLALAYLDGNAWGN